MPRRAGQRLRPPAPRRAGRRGRRQMAGPVDVALRAWVTQLHAPFITDFTGFDQPWRQLARHVPDLRSGNWPSAPDTSPSATPTAADPGPTQPLGQRNAERAHIGRCHARITHHRALDPKERHDEGHQRTILGNPTKRWRSAHTPRTRSTRRAAAPTTTAPNKVSSGRPANPASEPWSTRPAVNPAEYNAAR